MAKFALMNLSCIVFLVSILQGCSNEEEQAPATHEATVVERDVEEFEPAPDKNRDCSNEANQSADLRAWCRGLTAWKQSSVLTEANDAQKREIFINAYNLGQQDAAMVRNPQVHQYPNQTVSGAGYRAGYQAVTEAQGWVRYSCAGESADNEYQDRWCEASAAYQSSVLGAPDNAVLQGRYIDGYMAGRAIALTIPSAMEVMFSGETKAGARQTITEPSVMKNNAEKAFYQGFDEGSKVMMIQIQESINQLMEQASQGVDAMSSMSGMESMMPLEAIKSSE